LGLAADLDAAFTWHQKLAMGGDGYFHTDSQRRLAEAYEDGDLGRVIDLKVAVM